MDRTLFYALPAALFLFHPPAAPASAAVPCASQQEQARLTVEDVVELTGRILRPVVQGRPMGWLHEGSRYVVHRPDREDTPGGLFAVEAETARATPLFGRAAMEEAFAALPGISHEQARSWSRKRTYTFSPTRDAVLLNEAGDLFCYHFGEKRAVRLTHDPGKEQEETFSPDGTMVAFVRGHNLYVVPSRGGPERALTTEGHENLLLGRLDWVYQEEVYGRGNWRAYWWSPDSRRIAFLKLDQSPVGTFTVVDDLPLLQDVEHWRYPKAGHPNPTVELGVVDTAGGKPTWFDLSPYGGAEFLIVRVGWTPDGKEVLFQVQDRVQTWLDVVLGDPEKGKIRKLFRDTTGAWIAPTDAPFWRKDGKEFLWLSPRDGWRHLYVYDREGKPLRRLTEGEWQVRDVHGIDEEEGVVWFSGDMGDVKQVHLFKVGLDGSGLAAVTEERGTHSVTLSPDFRYFLDSFSSVRVPGRVELRRADGSLVRTLASFDPGPLERFTFAEPEFVQVPNREGFEMEAMLLRPPDSSAGGRHPVVVFNYSGPQAQVVRDRFMGRNWFWHQMLAQHGYVVWLVDQRLASNKGHVSTHAAWRNLGVTELADLEDSLDWLVEQGFVDPERIGIWGWSYGGYMAAYALARSKRFRAGIAGAPVTDWKLYDTIYTERFMDMPQRNPEGYAAGSVVDVAENLTGRLLLIHGTLDENVHLQNTLKLAAALQAAGKQFDLMLYPKNRHGITDSKQVRHLYQLMTDFVLANL